MMPNCLYGRTDMLKLKTPVILLASMLCSSLLLQACSNDNNPQKTVEIKPAPKLTNDATADCDRVEDRLEGFSGDIVPVDLVLVLREELLDVGGLRASPLNVSLHRPLEEDREEILAAPCS